LPASAGKKVWRQKFRIMSKDKDLKFNEVMALYNHLFSEKKAVRIDPILKTATPKTVAGRVREAIRLSKLLIWKRPSKR
jgi:hypothetical protein